ncbi:MAG: hypothetical protein AAGU11_23895, partial [Syntrophobacteraceae bacterium]
MIDTTSKRALPEWYRANAVQQIRPIDVDELTSERYFEKWDRNCPSYDAKYLFEKKSSLKPGL